jgi:hypothetical protein
VFGLKNVFTCSKLKLFTIYDTCATRNGRTTKKFPPSPFGAVVGSGILMNKNQDPG